MKTMNLRDANQQFSRLVREVEATGETVTILRNGKPAVKISAAVESRKGRTAEQEAALARIFDRKNHGRSPEGWRFNREELWDEIVSRHTIVRSADGKAAAKKARKRG